MTENTCLQDERWCEYLFERHSRNTIESWARKLKYFRYFRAHGGHDNDCDSFDLSIKYATQAELMAIFDKLKINYTILDNLPPQPVPGIRYQSDEFLKFKDLIPGTPLIEQPGKVQLSSCNAHIWCTKNDIKISVGYDNESWDVTEEDVIKCMTIENYISKFNFEFQDPPNDWKNYVCPKYYPEFFITGAQQDDVSEPDSPTR